MERAVSWPKSNHDCAIGSNPVGWEANHTDRVDLNSRTTVAKLRTRRGLATDGFLQGLLVDGYWVNSENPVVPVQAGRHTFEVTST